MNIKSLRAFRTTLTKGTLASAAEELHLSQPAVSRLISGLEHELKLTLFDRSNRALTPTEEGLQFYKEAGRILDNLDEIPRIANDIRQGKRQRLRVIAMPRIAHSVVVPAVADFMRSNPNVDVSLDIRTRREAERWIAGKEYDLGIGALPMSHPDIETTTLFHVLAQAVISNNSPLKGSPTVTAKQLAKHNIIRLMPGLLLREQQDDIFRSAGIEPQQICDVSSSEIACSLAKHDAGVAIADSLVASQVGGCDLVPIKPEKWMAFGLLKPNKVQQPKLNKMLIQCLLTQVENLSLKDKSIVLDSEFIKQE